MSIAITISKGDVTFSEVQVKNSEILLKAVHNPSGASVYVGPGKSRLKLEARAMAALQVEVSSDYVYGFHN